MPPKNWKRTTSYNAPKSRGGGGGGGGRGRGGGNNKNRPNNNNNNTHQKNNKNKNSAVKVMRRDVQIREQQHEYMVAVHCELALPDPMKAVVAKKAAETTPSHIQQQQQQQREQEQREEEEMLLENDNDDSNNVAGGGAAASPSSAQEGSTKCAFDPKQIVQIGFAVLHTPSGTVCGRLQSYVRAPPRAAPLTNYCCNVVGVTQRDVDTAPPLVDVLSAAESWVADVIAGRGDADVVVDLCEKRVENDDEEEEEEAEDEEGGKNGDNEDNSQQQQQQQQAKNETEQELSAPPSFHKVVLAADGVPSIAAIFHGQQQFTPPAAEDEEQGETRNQQQQKKSTSSFSHLNHLPGPLFTRWIDSRESFHRYFRVPNHLRLRLHDQMRELGLAFKGKSAHAAVDVAHNVCRLMVACMRKGIVYSYVLDCRSKHEGERVFVFGDRGADGGGGSMMSASKNNQSGDGGAFFAEAQNRHDARILETRNSENQNDHHNHNHNHHHHHHRKQESKFLVANSADLAMYRGVSTSSTVDPAAAGGERSLLASLVLNEVFLRWSLFLFCVIFCVFNIKSKWLVAAVVLPAAAAAVNLE